MGAKDSKPSCICYEDAIKRVSDLELRRIREAFKRSAGAGGTTLSKLAFIQDVLCEGTPTVVAEWLFAACGGTARGISFKELLCGLVLLTKGTQDEKIRFLWTLYCNDAGTHLTKQDFTKALQIETAFQPNAAGISLPNGSVVRAGGDVPQLSGGLQLSFASILVSMFGQNDRITFDQFRSWITMHKGATVLSRWLLLEPSVTLSSELETPTFYQSLAGVTHLEEQDIGDLEKVFWTLKGSAATGQLDLESLGPLLSPPVPKSALAGVFHAFDENRDGHIDFKELCCGVSAACRGPSVERSKFCFKVFDTDRDGVLNFVEIKQMIDVLLFVAQESSNAAATFKDVIEEQMLAELHARVNGTQQVCAEETKKDVSPFTITQEDFLMWSLACTPNIVQPFLDLLFEVCHIVLGLRPQCRHLENDIVKGWLAREVRRGYKVGQFWYLISADWFQNWVAYTQTQATSPCGQCKNGFGQYTNGRGAVPAPQAIDEAMVCDESFTSNSTESMGDLLGAGDSSSLGSGSSGISCGRHIGPPGQIDNASLIAPNIYKNVQSLTGEGGRLKRDLPLVQHRDFELVPDSLWKAFAQWYRGPLPLPRQVIQPPNSPDVELELYPLNLRVLRHQAPVTPSMQSTTTAWSGVSGGYGALASAGMYSSAVPSALQPPKRYLAYTAAFSRLATVRQVGEFLCARLKLRGEDVRLWHVFGVPSSNEMPFLLDDDHMTLLELGITDTDQILLEIRNKDLTWPEELGSLTLTQPAATTSERRPTIASIQSTHAPGATGLHNLGNTCFMNAALQVMFNTQPLAQYFRTDMHLYELNPANKLGTKGQLALRYAELLKEIWTASTRSIAPLKLRFCVTKHAPQFAGGGQHDSQELLEWLLDALHEDLNRVTEKPYAELKDSAGRADLVVAAEAWTQHHARNQSIVIDLFYGQLKSKVSCLACGHESVRFDPFSLLSLPLPVENYTYCEVLVIPLDGSIPIKYGVRQNSEAKYIDLKHQLATLCSIEPELMLICELGGSQVKCTMQNEQKIKLTTATELFCYEMPRSGVSGRLRTSSELGVCIEKGLRDIQRNPALLTMPSSLSLADTQVHTNPSEICAYDGTATLTQSPSINEDGCYLNGGAIIHSRQSSLDVDADADPDDDDERDHAESPEHGYNGIGIGIESQPKLTQPIHSATTNRRTSKHSTEISTSPDAFIASSNHHQLSSHSIHRKTISTTNLLATETTSHSSSLDETQLTNVTNCEFNEMDSRLSGGGSVGYLIAVHRKLTRQDTYLLSYHKTRPSLFGLPLLIPCYENGTNKDLYCAVWVQVARLLSPLPPTPPDQANHATDCDDSLGYEFPFTLRAIAEGGQTCALCPWSRFCRGCEIPCNDEPLLHGAIPSVHGTAASSREPSPSVARRPHIGSAGSRFNHDGKMSSIAIGIAIDWDPTALHLRYQSTREKIWTEHASVGICRKQQTEPVDLDHCLRSFTSEERLEQWYHCSHCRSKKPATKKLQIWKLPPILIVHLKRFNFVNNKWVKSQKVVNFPFDNFDPTSYLASVPQETILRHRDLSHSSSVRECNDIAEHPSGDSNEDANYTKLNGNNNCGVSFDDNDDTLDDKTLCNTCEADRPKDMGANVVKRVSVAGNTTLERRKRLISTSLTKTPVIDGEFIDFHDHKLQSDQDAFDLKYQLYAVVSHSGMLNGGHYISYAANPNGSWYCYNDSSCREIHQRPTIDPGSAYLLFYERKGLDYAPYLPQVDPTRPIPNGQQLAIDADDADGDLRKMCTIA